MKNLNITKGHILRLLSFCLLYLLYTLVGEIWLTTLYIHDNWIKESWIIIVAILLVPIYTFINTKLSLGIERYIFYIPILPFFIGMLLYQPIVNNLFQNIYGEDDLGVGILMIMIAFHHWASMILSFWLADKIKKHGNKV
jgi:hypothetical protein